MKFNFKFLKPAAFLFFLFLSAGILLGNLLPDYRIIAGFCIFFLILALCFIRSGRPLMIWGLFFSIGFICQQAQIYQKLPDNHISHYLDQGKYEIKGRVAGMTKKYTHRHRTVLDCSQLKSKDGRTIRVTGKINLTIYGEGQHLPGYNDTVVFYSKIKSIRNFQNPGAFDYQQYLKLKGIFGTSYTSSQKLKILSPESKESLFVLSVQAIETFRNAFSDYVQDMTGNSDSGKIIVSLITGKKELVSNDIRDLFSKAGISHLLAISGLHLSIIALICFGGMVQTANWLSDFLSKGQSFLTTGLITGQTRKIAGVLSIFPLFFYTAFSGFSPSAQRAFIMTTVFLFSFMREKEMDTLSSLSIAGIIILILDSTALFSISFQLSFMAVYFIIMGFVILREKNITLKKTSASKIMITGFITVFAGIGTAPLTAHYFHIASAVQLFTNFIAIPVLGFIVLPLGFAALFLFSFFPSVSGWMIQVCHFLVINLIDLSRYLAQLEFAWARIADFSIVESIAAYSVLIGIGLWLRNKKKTGYIILLVSLLLVGTVELSGRLFNPLIPQLKVTTLDVGQGASTLIQSSDQKAILVDGGGFSNRAAFDPGRFIVAPFLWKQNIKQLDYVILTHPEADHLNGLIYILENFKVGTLIKNQDAKPIAGYEKMMVICTQKKIPVLIPESYPQSIIVGNLKLTFWGAVLPNETVNNNSLVFKVSFHAFSMLFPGDIEKERETSLAGIYGDLLNSMVMISPHHGSTTSNHNIFLDKVDPESVIIPCGRQNRYGFPHQRVLNRYRKKKMNVFRTDEDGAVFTTSDGDTYQITTFKEK